jgi:tetratricopeptide (TPR) repeat protein
LLYWQTWNFDFITLDDNVNVYEDPDISAGLNWGSFVKVWTTVKIGYWIPLTKLTHLIDFSLYGMNAGGHHFTNVLLHAANVALLFWALRRMTGRMWLSAITAGLFGMHPLRVESVAWVVERKDVLSGLFWMLALLAWVRYVESGKARRYVWVAACFACGVMSKGSVVTLPFVLLLLDWWPLGRMQLGWRRLVLEKLPLFAIAALGSVITFTTQKSAGATIFLKGATAYDRVSNALVAYVLYLRDTVWPANLGVLYPYFFGRPVWHWVAAAGLLVTVTAAAVWQARRRPWLLVGWLWFVGVLVPMIGIVQAGIQSRADRFSYLPHIGLLIAVVWTLDSLLGETVTVRVGAVLVAAAAVVSRVQIGYWRDSYTLYERTLAAAGHSALINSNMAAECMKRGQEAPARSLLEQGTRLDPGFPDSYLNLGANALNRRSYEEVLQWMAKYHQLTEPIDTSLSHRALALSGLERFPEALADITGALKMATVRQAKADHYNSRAEILIRMGRYAEAQADCEAALREDSQQPSARRTLANTLAFQKQYARALVEYQRYLRQNPGDPVATKAANELRQVLGRP